MSKRRIVTLMNESEGNKFEANFPIKSNLIDTDEKSLESYIEQISLVRLEVVFTRRHYYHPFSGYGEEGEYADIATTEIIHMLPEKPISSPDSNAWGFMSNRFCVKIGDKNDTTELSVTLSINKTTGKVKGMFLCGMERVHLDKIDLEVFFKR